MDNRGPYTVAMPSNKRVLTLDQEREVAQLYDETDTPVPEIKETYGISDSVLYRLLQTHGVTPRLKRNVPPKNGRIKITKIDPAKLELPPEIEVPVMHTSTTEVVVDKQNLVQTVTRHSSRRLHTWEIQYSGTVLVEADEIEEAIREARKLGVVKRIHSVTEKKE